MPKNGTIHYRRLEVTCLWKNRHAWLYNSLSGENG